MVDRLNVLLVVLDNPSAETVEGPTPAPMPYLASRPYGSWTKFTQSIAALPLCAPSRGTLQTGQFAVRHGVMNNHPTGDYGPGSLDLTETLPVWLRRSGYRTGIAGKFINYWPLDNADSYVPPGWDDFRCYLEPAPTLPSYFDYSLNENGAVVAYGSADTDYSTYQITQKTVDFITANAGRRWFYQTSHWASHTPLALPTDFVDPYAAYDVTAHRPTSWNEDDITDKPQWFQDHYWQKPNPANVEPDLVDAYRSLRIVDDGLETIMDTLNSTGQLDSTVVIVMPDNTNLFLEHRLRGKPFVYEECLSAQMWVRWPGAMLGAESDAMVSNLDVVPTICDLARARPRIAPDGMSMRPLFDGTLTAAQFRQDILLEARGQGSVLGGNLPSLSWWGVRTFDGRKLIEYDEHGEWESMNLASDPTEVSCGGYDATLDRRLQRLKGQVPHPL